jgi:hypothetical protein
VLAKKTPKKKLLPSTNKSTTLSHPPLSLSLSLPLLANWVLICGREKSTKGGGEGERGKIRAHHLRSS